MPFEPEPFPPSPESLAERSCVHCGVHMMLGPDYVVWVPRCRIDARGRNCEGRCSQYRPRWWARLAEWVLRMDERHGGSSAPWWVIAEIGFVAASMGMGVHYGVLPRWALVPVIVFDVVGGVLVYRWWPWRRGRKHKA